MHTSQELRQKAWKFATAKHQGQFYGDEHYPYLVHLGGVLLETIPALGENQSLDADLAVCCAVLHDTVEDTDTTLGELAENFGGKIAEGVAALTKNKSLKGLSATKDSLERIRLQPAEVWVVKLADRSANLGVPPAFWTQQKRLSYIQEAEIILQSLGGSSSCLAARLASRIDVWKNLVGINP
ncbi:MAG: HD domain-containing protein [Planctomycetota bacterium]|nr:HD domain-containing protein [Planctomycetota bacterium]